MEANLREQRCSTLENEPFDAVIVGGGISGAAIFARLARSGYRILLIDKGDFGSLTSQESAMMIWGGLLYLTRLDFRTVYSLSRNRDQLLQHFPHAVHAQYYRYLPLRSGWQVRPLVKGFFDFYRVLGGLRRGPNFIEENFAEESIVAMSRYRGSVAYEEAMLTSSDTRFVLDLIRSHDSSAAIPLNYVSLAEGEFDHSSRLWQLGVHEQFGGVRYTVKARMVINATGPYVDTINRQFSIDSPYKHVFSKGVFLSFARPQGHDRPLLFELGQNRDAIAFIPWGPVSLWGPTEAVTPDLEKADEPSEDEVTFLLEQASRTFSSPLTARDIVAFRSGVRPLVVKTNYQAERYPLELSRHHRIHVNSVPLWISVYGGKFTSALGMADSVTERVRALLGQPRLEPFRPLPLEKVSLDTIFPGLDGKYPSIRHCVDHEYCMTIGDYLRRRTNIAQWLPRNGLGNAKENLPFIEQLASQLPATIRNQTYSLDNYVKETERVFDRLQNIGEVENK